MKWELKDHMLNLAKGDHLCLFYDEDPVEQLPALVPFLQDALEHDEQFIYVADDQGPEELGLRLKEHGVDVCGATRSGRLKLWTRQEWRQPGELSSRKKARQLRGLVEDALNSGFKGIRFAVEMTWTLGPDVRAEQLEHWEATINTVFIPGFPGRIICQYNRSRLPPGAMLAALHTHPQAVLGKRVCPNPFYEAPLILRGQTGRSRGTTDPAARVAWMFSQLQNSVQAEKERVELNVERRRAEEALRLSEEALRATREALLVHAKDLENKVQERTARLQGTIGDLEAFSYSVSHDMRAPLRAMQGFADALLCDYEDRLDEQGKDYLRRIHRASHRLDLFIRDVLTYSRISKEELVLRRLDLDELIPEIVQSYPEIEASASRIKIQKPLQSVIGHEAFLSQAVSNLIGNALKFVAPGVTPQIRVWSEPFGEMVRVIFADNGLGIAPEHSDRIFQIFGRVYSEKRFEGTGIGLAIVKKAIERMGGEVGVDSALGAGSQFWINLKRAV